MTYDLGSQTVDGHAPTPSGELGQAVGGHSSKPIRWNTNHIHVLAKGVGSSSRRTATVATSSLLTEHSTQLIVSVGPHDVASTSQP